MSGYGESTEETAQRRRYLCRSLSVRMFAITFCVQLTIVVFCTDVTSKLESYSRNVTVVTGLSELVKYSLRHGHDGYVITPHSVLTDYPYWNIMSLPTDKLQFITSFKNPCFYAERTPNACDGALNTAQCDDVTLHCLPYFLLVGFAKGGTTDLHAKITAHQQVGRFLCSCKCVLQAI